MSGTMQSGTSATQSQANNVQNQNALANNLIRAQALDMTQQIYSNTFDPNATNTVNIVPRNVGLLRGFWIEVAAKMSVASGTAALTDMGPYNLLSQISFFDLNNNVRHQTTGWHLGMIDTVRKGYPYSQGFTVPGPINFNPKWAHTATGAVANLPTSVPSDTNVSCLYFLPISYTRDDMRGSIFMGVTNATANLQLTLNINGFAVASGGDPTLAVYVGGTTPVWSSATVTVYQDYYDQLPVGSNGTPVLPLIDISTIYELKTTALTGINVGQDFPIPYSNFRSFLSTMMYFDNGGSLNAGQDINYLALQAANFTNMVKTDPYLWQSWLRDEIMCDPPAGLYYLSHRRRPLNTNQYGNLQLILNASTVNSGAQVLMGYEDFALVNTIQLAQSLPGS
jgi:hypothetical protein